MLQTRKNYFESKKLIALAETIFLFLIFLQKQGSLQVFKKLTITFTIKQ